MRFDRVNDCHHGDTAKEDQRNTANAEDDPAGKRHPSMGFVEIDMLVGAIAPGFRHGTDSLLLKLRRPAMADNHP
jgi:hypothetical protein